MTPPQTSLVTFPGGHDVRLLKFRADKHDFANGWENEYLQALAEHLKPGMVVYDVGAENGEFGAFAATIVKPHNVHLFEPSRVYWPNLHALWQANGFDEPGGCYYGFVDEMVSGVQPSHFGWPVPQVEGPLFEDTAHLCLHQQLGIPSTNLDHYAQTSARHPDVLLIDIEGAEVRALKGAYWTLQRRRPTVFLSLHSADMLRNHGSTEGELFKFMAALNYEHRLISEDHEKHYQFSPK